MFLGYTNDRISYMASTKEELENIPCVEFDKIEETDDNYVLLNGKYIPESEIGKYYATKRQSEYPPIEEQLDMIYHDMENNTNNWQKLIKSIKEKYPKI